MSRDPRLFAKPLVDRSSKEIDDIPTDRLTVLYEGGNLAISDQPVSSDTRIIYYFRNFGTSVISLGVSTSPI